MGIPLNPVSDKEMRLTKGLFRPIYGPLFYQGNFFIPFRK